MIATVGKITLSIKLMTSNQFFETLGCKYGSAYLYCAFIKSGQALKINTTSSAGLQCSQGFSKLCNIVLINSLCLRLESVPRLLSWKTIPCLFEVKRTIRNS